MVQERRKYGALGWNIRYDFMDGDLTTALQTLNIMLSQGQQAQRGAAQLQQAQQAQRQGQQWELPWRALSYVTGQINYGGRVTDDNDRRLLGALLDRYYCHDTLQPGYSPLFTTAASTTTTSSSRPGQLPDSGDVADYVAYIQALPSTDCPEVFGLHANADTAFQLQESDRILTSILALQPRIATSAGGRSSDEIVRDLSEEILASLPDPLTPDHASAVKNPFAPLPSGQPNSLATVLRQELARYSRLLLAVGRSLRDLLLALRGAVVMSSELEQVYRCLLDNQVGASRGCMYCLMSCLLPSHDQLDGTVSKLSLACCVFLTLTDCCAAALPPPRCLRPGPASPTPP